MNKLILCLLLSAVFLLSVARCTSKTDTTAFPVGESEFDQPTTSPLTFSDPKPFQWQTASLDTLPVSESRFNLSKIPAILFDNGDFKPFVKPPETAPYDYDKSNNSPFSLDSLPTYIIQTRTNLLGKPKRTKANFPRLRDDAKQDILIFNQDQGLPGNVGFKFLQDSRGWIWIGTDNGLCRYDGEYCEVYTAEQGLADNNVLFMAEDKQGKLWLQNRTGGVDALDLGAGTLTHFSGSPEFNKDVAQFMLVDSKNRVWIGTMKHGLYLLDERRKTLKNISTKQGLSDYEITSLMEHRDGTIWVGTFRGLDVIDLAKDRLVYPMDAFGRLRVMDLGQDREDKVWISVYEQGVYIVDQATKSVSRITPAQGLSSANVVDLECDSKGRTWICTSTSGVNVIDLKNKTFRVLNEANGLSNNNLWNIIEDNQEQIWIGASAGGVNIINLNGGEKKHLGTADGLSGSNMKGFCLDNQKNLWLASIPGGIDVLSPDQRSMKNVSKYLKLPINDACWDIEQDQKGRIWAGTNNGIFVLDPQKGTIKHLLQGLNSQYVNGLFVDKKGIIWAATQGAGIVLIDLDKNSLQFLNSSNGLSNDFPGNFWQAPNGEVWVGTEGGGINIVDEGKKTIRYLGKHEGLPNEMVRALTADSEQRVWAATYGGGVVRVDLDKLQCTNFTTANGLGEMTVVSLKEWEGKMYAGTGKGLTQIATVPGPNGTSRWELKTLTRQQGLLKSDFNTNAFFITPNGQFWLGASDVLTTMKQAFTPPETGYQPSPNLTSLGINDVPQDFVGKIFFKQALQSVDTVWNRDGYSFYTKDNLPEDSSALSKTSIQMDSLSGTWHLPQGLVLPYDQNHLTFHFTGTRLSDPNKTRYRYFLQGNDAQWNTITEEPSADYRNLSPGSYVFKLSSQGFNGPWSTPVEFAFRITPPWWQTWWAYLLYIVILGLVVVEAVKLRTRTLEKQKRLLENTVDIRTRELKATTTELSESLDELKTTQEELVRQEKLASIGQLTKGIVDRILNPLNYINNFSQSSVGLVEEVEEVFDKNRTKLPDHDNEEVEDSISMLKMNLTKINEHGNSTARIVGDMQRLLKKRSVKFVETELNQYLRIRIPVLVEEALKKEKSALAIDLSFQLAPVPLSVLLLPDEFEQSLRNMIHNSCYALIEKKKPGEEFKPSIVISTVVEDEMVKIRVRDNGKGIAKKELDQICSPFFTTKPTAQGTGLGLFMTKEIIEDHKGTLDVTSVEREFTQITVSLPLVSVEVLGVE